MTNAELIKAMRICANQTCCDNCPRYDIDHTQDAQRCCIQLINDAADALEAAEQRIAELQRILKAVQENSGINFRLWQEAAAMMPKEGVWIWDQARCIYRCSKCKSPKAREDMDRRPVKEQSFCHNCGAKMRGEQE